MPLVATIPFCMLPEYRSATTALDRLGAAMADEASSVARLVYLKGPSGIGKSLLIREWLAGLNPETKAECLTGLEFATLLADASSERRIPAFLKRHRSLGLLVLEDVHLIGGRHETQHQLVEAIDHIMQGSGGVVVTSRTMPGRVEKMSRRLVDRLRGGITAEIPNLSPESRSELVSHFCEVLDLKIPHEAREFIAETAQGSGAELKAVLLQVRDESALRGEVPSMRSVKRILSAVPKWSTTRLQTIIQTVGRHFGTTLPDLRSASRKQAVTQARQLAMWLMRTLTGASYEAIGGEFGGRNHTTVMHACRKVDSRIDSDAAYAAEVTSLTERLSASATA